MQSSPRVLLTLSYIGAGARSDLIALQALVTGGASEKEIMETQFGNYIRMYRGINRARNLIIGDRNWSTETLVYWGPPGTGKTRHALELGPDDDQFWLGRPRTTAGGAWWDGYDGQHTVVIDEFYGWLTRDLLQRICDRYPLMVETKGGATKFLAKRVIITSNLPPHRWYRKLGLGAMVRRFTEPLGYVFYLGNDEFPDPESYCLSMGFQYLGLTSEPGIVPLPPRSPVAGVAEPPPAVSDNLRRVRRRL